MFIIVFSLIIAAYFAGHYYVGLRLYRIIMAFIPNLSKPLFSLLIVLLALSFILGRLPLGSGIKSFFTTLGSYWLGLWVYLFLGFLVADGLIGLSRLFSLVGPDHWGQFQLYARLVATLMAVILVGIGVYGANQTRVVNYQLELKHRLAEPMKVVLISDLHLGDTNSEKRLGSIVEAINAQAPDLVLIPGDIFSDDYYSLKDPDLAKVLLQSIQSTYGVYASLGNHDAGKTLPEMLQFLEQSNITLLHDQYTPINDQVLLLGRLDPSPIGGFGSLQRTDFSALETPPDSNQNIIVMDHNPINIAEYADQVSLIVSGHTHKGQIFPGNLITRAIYQVDYGHYQADVNSPHVIVSSGVGTWGLPMRLGSHNEIVVINLR